MQFSNTLSERGPTCCVVQRLVAHGHQLELALQRDPEGMGRGRTRGRKATCQQVGRLRPPTRTGERTANTLPATIPVPGPPPTHPPTWSLYPSQGRDDSANMDRSPRTLAANSLGGRVPRNRVRVSLQAGRASRQGKEGVQRHATCVAGGWASGVTSAYNPETQQRCTKIASPRPPAHLSCPVTLSTSVRSSTPLTRPT